MKSSRRIYISLLLLATVLCQGQATEEENDDLIAEAIEEVESEYAVDESELSPVVRRGYLDADTDYKERYSSSDYTYRERDEKPTQVSKPAEIEEPSAPQMSGDFVGIILKILLGIVAIAIILFIVMALKDVGVSKVGFKKNVKEVNRKISTQVNELETLTELDQTNLQLLLKNALAAEDFYSAVRYYFLIYLEKLERKKEIVYHQDKTNADYLVELANSPSSETFAQLSYLYEYLWYGKKELTVLVFEQVSDTFKKAINK